MRKSGQETGVEATAQATYLSAKMRVKLSQSYNNRLLAKPLAWLLAALVCCAPALTLAQQAEAGDNAPAADQEDSADYSLKAVLELLGDDQELTRKKLQQREARFSQRLDDAMGRLKKAQDRLASLEAEGRRLEGQFDDNKVELNDKAELLKNKIGALKELFGVFQQNASDLIGAFVASPTSLQYPNRDVWLEGFANRMKNASEVSSADDIKTLWFEVQREILARSEIVRLQAPVLTNQNIEEDRELVRVGGFNLVSAEPRPQYLRWDTGDQQVQEIPRQPAGPYLAEIDSYLNARSGLSAFSTDPTGGVLLGLLAEKPNTRERVDQGGLVGYMILSLGAVALLLALIKLLDISLISLRVAKQQKDLNQAQSNNSLGRLLLSYEKNRAQDAETLEMRLHEQVLKEESRIHRFTIFLAIIAAVAPLMGLLGTVVGMINTFQAITLYGTGDPQTMAGGISQALITTVLGLIVAVPAVLLHAMVNGRGKAVVNVLKQQSALLLGNRIEEQAKQEEAAEPALAPQPA